MANIVELIASTDRSLKSANDLSNINGDDREAIEWLITACSRLLQIIELQETRNQHVAKALDELAASIGYPVNSTSEMRKRVRAVAAIVRGEGGKA